MKSMVLILSFLFAGFAQAACPVGQVPYKNICWTGASAKPDCAVGQVYLTEAEACVPVNGCPVGYGFYHGLCDPEATLIEQCRYGHIDGPACQYYRNQLQRR